MSKHDGIVFALIHYTKSAFTVAFFTLILLLSARPVLAAPQPHYSLIINQVRAGDAFDPGNVDFLQRQVSTLRQNKLTGTFAIRYDALSSAYIPLLKQALADGDELAGLLEVTPGLATDSGVLYRGSLENQYLAANAYLLGYAPPDRKKLIDTYMARFRSSFGFLPKTTVAWMIDAYSLQYLSDRYQVTAHEITREQWNTDSATLVGGPPHYPYYPSRNWAMIPSAKKTAMPLVIRQTITDPVENYGDFTDSHTSQPNDYARRSADFSYFTYLFNQAHNQPLNPYTIAVVGLENSMAKAYQDEFAKQIDYIAGWQKKDISNQVVTVQDFLVKNSNINSYPQIYEGTEENKPTSKAWWVTTPSYRVRLRLSNGSLYVSDIRIYNQDFTDPYLDTAASDGAFWVVPFILDGSRFVSRNKIYQHVLSPLPDTLTGRKSTWSMPTRIELQNNVTDFQLSQFKFTNDWFEIPYNSKFILDNPIFEKIIRYTFRSKLEWAGANGKALVRLDLSEQRHILQVQPWSDAGQLTAARDSEFSFLLPHLSDLDVNFDKSVLYVNNRYSVFGRNPVRLVLFPEDVNGYPAKVSPLPAVTTEPPAKNVVVGTQDYLSGAIYLDIFPSQPGKMKVDVRVGSTNLKETVYSSPDCKRELVLCLSRPWYIWWYMNIIWPF